MVAADILKSQKIVISLLRTDRFWWNLAHWCNSTLQISHANKNCKFKKLKMALADILKTEKSW